MIEKIPFQGCCLPCVLLTLHSSKAAMLITYGMLAVSFLVSGIRSEYSSLPRSTLAESSINHAEQHTRHAVAVSLIQRSSTEGRVRDRAALGYAAGTGRTTPSVIEVACTPSLSYVHVPQCGAEVGQFLVAYAE